MIIKNKDKERIGPENMNVDGIFKELPLDVIRSKVAPHLSTVDCAAMAGVCKALSKAIMESNQCLSVLDQRLYDKIIFGKKDWKKLGIDVDDEPQLTLNQKVRLLAKFKGPCPFFHKKLFETFKIILIPKSMDINDVGKIFGERNFIFGDKNSDYRTKKVEESKFIVASMDAIPGSRERLAHTNLEILQSKGYRVPTPLEAVITVGVLKVQGCYFGNEGKYTTYSFTDGKFLQTTLIVGADSTKEPKVGLFFFEAPDSYGAAAVVDLLEFLGP